MDELNYRSLLYGQKDPSFESNVGRASKGNLDKTACFYHVITKSFTGGTIFYKEPGSYRHNLLCQVCEEKGVLILFSLTMPNHTHDVFLTPSWDALVEVLRIVDKNVSGFIRKKYPERFQNARRILRRYPSYIPVRDVVQLFCLGKYIYDNPLYMSNGHRDTPHSCFWMFESGHFVAGYDKSIYEKLFGISPQDLFNVYSTMNSKEVSKYAVHHLGDWSEEKTRAVFYR